MELTVKVTANQRELAELIFDGKAKATEDGKSIVITHPEPLKVINEVLEKALVTGSEEGKSATVIKGLFAKVERHVRMAQVNSAPPAPRTVNKPYVNKERTRRGTGTKTRILYLLAADKPADAVKPVKGEDGKELVFAAECVTHNAVKHVFTYAAAYKAAKVSPEWCAECGPAAEQHAAAKAAAAEVAKEKAAAHAVKPAEATKPAESKPAVKAAGKAPAADNAAPRRRAAAKPRAGKAPAAAK